MKWSGALEESSEPDEHGGHAAEDQRDRHAEFDAPEDERAERRGDRQRNGLREVGPTSWLAARVG